MSKTLNKKSVIDGLDKVLSYGMDFCNDGEYTDDQFIDCLSSVIKTKHAKLQELRDKLQKE